MEQDLRKIVEHIFNNWTALKLAVEHSMAGPISLQIATQTVDYIANYLASENGIEVEDIEDVLEDIMDQEFHTICEDNSIKEISTILMTFLQLLKNNSKEQAELEFSKLPVSSQWLNSTAVTLPEVTAEVSVVNEETTKDEPMDEEEPGWTQVKTKRKR